MGIIDTFIADGVGFPILLDRTVTPTNPSTTNLHGVYAEGDTVVVTDVGDAASASDGQLLVLVDDGTLDGAAVVAEKSNDAVLVFENVATSGGERAPSFMQAFTKPESIEVVSRIAVVADYLGGTRTARPARAAAAPRAWPLSRNPVRGRTISRSSTTPATTWGSPR